ncbi:MAG: hydroxymethylbilane synthase [Flavobacteriales bacterium]|nr:hydroxymethylbilane synthase [Flavobacteriales bacterium]PIV92987.1 MAG: hydroxymethylbilane synthase [Flavobacteriaceae bacterium CG17_big_fil_post_rev_8_21_14_2_50_33_15]PIY13457.1 MAG: hydroxymethylbilane synthase [Flavobacteriaceae bacterium CG_4_10_14_3_um_filter_33_47]PJB18474.1 MAG: hydroxymethylbilane synthase [Flavobacteriaceae bacterium CG_4_9_14_3_um_filter_33_16]NCP60398.1 hydroxymethylbilane synthase [Flavobacteriales bacterium]
MSKIIRIGTRDSELALWQAKTVQTQLENLGYETSLVPVKSTGDLVLDKPLYQLGITGIFTRTLDIAMLNHDIDIAVHSLKDVPTVLPNGIIQAAVIKRGNINDTLVFKNNEEFLSQKEAVIATGSLRRRAQWLNRYPTHTIVDLRGNMNSRMQKLQDNDQWNGAIFAAAGLGRIGIRPEEAINLDWMIPAPAQGAVMITALKENEFAVNACAELNHEETEICTSIEREFLNRLEGGCTAPIGAIAQIKNDEVVFKGVLLSIDGSKRIDVTRVKKLGEHHDIADYSANFIIERGGKRLMDELQRTKKTTTVYSTKALTEDQKHLLNTNITVKSSDFIKISLNRIPKTILKSNLKNVIITSKNAVEAIITNLSSEELQFKNIYCVGRRTKQLIEKKIGQVTHSENNAKNLANYLVDYMEGTEITYFCSDIRLDELPKILEENNITLHEVEAYKTVHSSIKVDESTEAIMFYSPSTVQSYMLQNKPKKIAFCIGETTAEEAKKHFKDVRIAKVPTVESVIELVNDYYV